MDSPDLAPLRALVERNPIAQDPKDTDKLRLLFALHFLPAMELVEVLSKYACQMVSDRGKNEPGCVCSPCRARARLRQVVEEIERG